VACCPTVITSYKDLFPPPFVSRITSFLSPITLFFSFAMRCVATHEFQTLLPNTPSAVSVSRSWARCATEPVVFAILSDAASIPLFNFAEIQNLLQRTCDGRASDAESQRLIWRWVSFVGWVREFNVSFQ